MTTCRRRFVDARQQKESLLPQIAQLAREGLSCREIGKKIGVSKSAVDRWLRALRREPPQKNSPDPAIAIREKIARYKSIRDDLLQAWRLSQAEKQVCLVENTSTTGDDGAKRKESTRKETQTGNATYLAKAMDAQRRIDDLDDRLAALEQAKVAGPGKGPANLADLSDDDLEKLTPDDLDSFTDDELFAVEVRLRAKHGVTDSPLLTNEDLDNMTGEQLDALELELLDEIQRLQNAPQS